MFSSEYSNDNSQEGSDYSRMYPPPMDNDYLRQNHYQPPSSTPVAVPSNLPTRLRNLTSGFAAPVVKLTNQKRCSLPAGYVPGDRDVICGRGKKNWGHPGNVYFRNVIRMNVNRYIDAPSKNDKTLVVISIVDEVRAEGGRFLKDDIYGRWYDIGDAQARDKVGHSFRDQVTALNRQNSSNDPSTTAKRKKGFVSSHDVDDDGPEQYDEAMIDDIVEQVMMDQASLSYEDAAVTLSLPVVLERNNSFRSDSGNEIEARRHSLFSSSLMHSFTRRPSLLAFSFGSRESTRNRASSLVGGDVKASMNLESFRRSSNWDFLANMEDMDVDFLGEDIDLDHIQLENSNASLYSFRDSDVRSFAQI